MCLNEQPYLFYLYTEQVDPFQNDGSVDFTFFKRQHSTQRLLRYRDEATRNSTNWPTLDIPVRR